MAAELGGKQLSTLLESLPGIASVLRSPVADAMVGMIRAGAGLGEFREAEAKELVQYATRRGLMGHEEGDQLLAELKTRGRQPKVKPIKVPKPKKVTKTVKSAPVKKTVVVKKKTTAKKTFVKQTAAKKTAVKKAKKTKTKARR